jgi:hypothetical protein
MNSKIVKEIHKVLRTQYPNLEHADPKQFKRAVKVLKDKWKDTPKDQRKNIKIEGNKNDR